MPLNLCNRLKLIYRICKVEFSLNLEKCVTDRTYFHCSTFLLFTQALALRPGASLSTSTVCLHCVYTIDVCTCVYTVDVHNAARGRRT